MGKLTFFLQLGQLCTTPTALSDVTLCVGGGGKQQIYFLGVSTANKSPYMNYGARCSTQYDTAVINAGVISYAGELEETNW